METITSHPFDLIMPGPYSYVGVSTPGSRQEKAMQDNAKGSAFHGSAFLSDIGNFTKGGTCAHCGKAIQDLYRVRGANGVFTLGSSCVKKLDVEPEIKSKVAHDAKQVSSDRRKARIDSRFKADKAWLAEFKDSLQCLPHPKGWEDKSLYDQLSWMLCHAGKKRFSDECTAARNNHEIIYF